MEITLITGIALTAIIFGLVGLSRLTAIVFEDWQASHPSEAAHMCDSFAQDSDSWVYLYRAEDDRDVR